MALWTPYAEETALDLSKPVVKEERLSPEAAYPVETLEHPFYGYPYIHQSASLPAPLPVPLPMGHPVYYGYQYPQPAFRAPSVQMSPESACSTCSGYESAPAPAVPVSPSYGPKAVPLSPPESPISQKRCYADVDELSDDPNYKAFEENALRVMAEKNGGALLGNNPRMRRAVKSTNQDSANDSYRKQRERNNFAAKQSRDRRKMREIHLALKVSYLKNEMAKLKAQLAASVCGRCHQQC
ncbi:D site-binding protein-like [Plodia interpunctella]|uniref:D site-binding protein-like n=1 Tax=Plodia interpunctella TaxID=58824 RepID=UPI0023674BFE|nr:D site-binding protein-like [Plodia interpunctella]